MKKRKIYVPMSQYFELAGTNHRLFILNDGTRLDFRLGFPSNCKEIFIEGKFQYLALKPEAKDLFKKEPKTLIRALIQKSTRQKDIEILSELL